MGDSPGAIGHLFDQVALAVFVALGVYKAFEIASDRDRDLAQSATPGTSARSRFGRFFGGNPRSALLAVVVIVGLVRLGVESDRNCDERGGQVVSVGSRYDCEEP